MTQSSGCRSKTCQWLHYAGHEMAPICRTRSGSNTAVSDTLFNGCLDFWFVPVFSFGLLWPFSIRVDDCRHAGRLISVLQTIRPLLEAWGASDGVLKAFNRVTKPFGFVSLCNP